MEETQIKEILKKSENKIETLKQLIHNPEIKIGYFDNLNMICQELSDSEKIEIIKNKELLNELNLKEVNEQKLESNSLLSLMGSLSSDEEKLKLLTDKKFLEERNIIKTEGIVFTSISNVVQSLSTDEAKLNIIKDTNHVKELELKVYNISNIIQSLSTDEAKLNIIKDKKFLKELEFDVFNIKEIIQSLSTDEAKLNIIKDKKFLKELEFDAYKIKDIIQSLSTDEAKLNIIKDKNLVKELEFDAYEIKDIIQNLSTDEAKLEILKTEDFIKNNNLNKWEIIDIIETFSSNDKKIEAAVDKELIKKLKTKDELPVEDMKTISKKILTKIEPEEERIEILNNKEKIEELKIDEKDFIEIVEKLSSEELKENILKKYDITLEEIQEEEKNNYIQDGIQTSHNPTEEVNTQVFEEEKIVDLNEDLEKYKEKNEKLVMYPETLEEVEKEKANQLCKIYPNLEIRATILDSPCTVEEYEKGEKWIQEVLSKIKPEYTEAQKILIIDHEIGKKISYSPDFETEVYSVTDSRNIWRIICTGYGVCNGIANLERYMLEKIGIESELITSQNHAFLKIKDIEIPRVDGTTQRGTTIVDPTWNLAAQRFDTLPNYLFTSYEEARKGDIYINGDDSKSHRNNTRLQDATTKIESQALKELYDSVGLTQNKELKGKKTLDISQKIHEIYANNPKQEIEEQFNLLKKVCPEFATCQNSTMAILSGNFLKNVEMERCVVTRVYDKEDTKKDPKICVYAELDEEENIFYYSDKDEGKFIEIPEKEFKEKFECYQIDLIEGKRPWEIKEQETKEEDLTKSSGTIKQDDTKEKEGEER